MKLKSFFLFVIASLFPALAQSEGGNSSGGGGAYVCRDSNHRIISSQLVDLWESQNTPFNWPKLGNRPINIDLFSLEPVDAQIKHAIDRLRILNPFFADAMEREVSIVQSAKRYLPDGVSLTIPQDLNTDYFPTGCPPEGMMRYNGYSQTLDIDRGIFEKLQTPTDTAASYLHEAAYKILRTKNSDWTGNSRLVRRLIACLFSSECMANIGFTLPENPTEIYSCSSENLDAKIYRYGRDKFIINFSRAKNLHFSITAGMGLEFYADGDQLYLGQNTNWLNLFQFPMYFSDMINIWEIDDLNLDEIHAYFFIDTNTTTYPYPDPGIIYEKMNCKKE